MTGRNVATQWFSALVHAVEKVGGILLTRNNRIIGVGFLNQTCAIDAHRLVMTSGQARDAAAFLALLQKVDCDPEQLLGDKGHDSDAVRQELPTTAAKPLFKPKMQQTVGKAA